MREWNFWETSLDSISIQIPFMFIFVPVPKGRKTQPDSESLPLMISWLAFLSTSSWCSHRPFHVNPRRFALTLPWIRGWISTFCPVFRRLHTGRERRGCICCNRSPDWVMSCNNSADWGRRLSGLEMAVPKTNHRDRNTHYTGVNSHNRPVCLCLMPPTNKQQPGRWWISLHRNSDVGFYVCVLSRAFIHPAPFVSESGEWSSVIEERKHKLWASDGVCS